VPRGRLQGLQARFQPSVLRAQRLDHFRELGCQLAILVLHRLIQALDRGQRHAVGIDVAD
jgi:hypothetical protein